MSVWDYELGDFVKITCIMTQPEASFTFYGGTRKALYPHS
jgi:hypothetical protein